MRDATRIGQERPEYIDSLAAATGALWLVGVGLSGWPRWPQDVVVGLGVIAGRADIPGAADPRLARLDLVGERLLGLAVQRRLYSPTTSSRTRSGTPMR